MNVTLIDYGIGNILSVTRALEYCGANVVLTSSPDEILKAERLVLPGVGAIADAMAGLRERGLIEPIQAYAKTGNPLLGICVGMQMFFDRAHEFGTHAGLGLIPGEVVEIARTTAGGEPHKIPHIGWNGLHGKWAGTALADLHQGDAVYFVHSFMAVPKNSDNLLASCDYNGRQITAAVHSGAITGCQFHPEKSGEIGLKILRRFVS